MGVKRFGVAFVASAAIVLAYAVPARAQEAPPPAPSSPAETTTSEAATPAPDAPPPTPSSTEPAKSDTPTADAAPSTETAKADTSSTDSAPAPDAKSTEPAKTEPATTGATEAKPAEVTPAAKDPVKLEPATAAPAAPASSPPAAAPAPQAAPAPAASPASTQVTIVLEATAPAAADPATSATGSAAEAAETAAAMIVSFRPRRAPAAISLLPTVERTVVSASPAPRRATPAKAPVRAQKCARPTARVPLSADCEQARAISALRVRLRYMPGSEVREAIIRGPTRISIRRVEAPPPRASKAAKKHPVAAARPTAPFGSSGQGAANHSFNRSTGASSSSRVLVLAAPSFRLPRPSRFVRLRLPSMIPTGAIAAPPPARPG